MTYIKINETLYPATIAGRVKDMEWDSRESKAITLTMSYEEAATLFVDGLVWSIVYETSYINEEGEAVTTQEEYDNSEYDVAGNITDHRNGTLTIKMGKLTALEQAISIAEINAAYEKGVQNA